MFFSVEEFSRLTYGLIPEQMEDKWFIFYHDEWLYFHRSWTGYGIYKAKLLKEKEGYSIREFWVERNQEKYTNQNDQSDIQDFSFLIATGLLGIQTDPLNLIRNIQSGTDALKAWSSFGRMLSGDKEVNVSGKIKSVLFGVAVGDALGVPVEFKSREWIRRDPVEDMLGYGSHNQPPGTWSDDSSLTFCLAESLTGDFGLHSLGQNFVKWAYENYWTARGSVFDIGVATRQAIDRLAKGEQPDLAGGSDESSNGNGSLMRILPLVFYILNKSVSERFEITRQVSSLTHRHIRSVIACFYYLEFARHVLGGKDKFTVYENLQSEIPDFLKSLTIPQTEISLFNRLLREKIHEQKEDKIHSSGYVLHTLEASIWCLLTTDNYREAVLKAVNLGDDTDTTGAVTGGLAGLLYGMDNIPDNWIKQLARYPDIENLGERAAKRISNLN